MWIKDWKLISGIIFVFIVVVLVVILVGCLKGLNIENIFMSMSVENISMFFI